MNTTQLLQSIIDNFSTKPQPTKDEQTPESLAKEVQLVTIGRKSLHLDRRGISHTRRAQKTHIQKPLNWGHPGRDSMLQEVADIRRPRIHRDIVLLAQSCPQCQQAGKNLETLKTHSEFGKLPAADIHNDELKLEFAGPLQIARKTRKYLLVSKNHETISPDATFVAKPTAERVVNFLNAHIEQFGIPKRIRTDSATIFRGEVYTQFCQEHFIEGQFKKKSWTIVAESNHTVTIVTKHGRQVILKLDIATKVHLTVRKQLQKEEIAIHWR